MTVQNPAVFLQSEAHPAEDVRRMLTAIAGTTGGVVDTGALAVSETSGAPSMGVDVAGGRAWIAGSEATYQGVYFAENRGVETLTIGASDPTNGRYDLIVAKVEDSAYSGSVNAWSLVVVAGTADPSPVDPATPANSITLARVTVGAGVSTITDANITDLRNVVGLEARVADLETPPVDTKTASYTLVAADKNSRVVMNSASATTITVDDGVFAAGDSVWIHNIGAGTCTVTAGTATVDTSASLDVGQWEGGSLYFTSASGAIFFRGGGAGVTADFLVIAGGGGGGTGGSSVGGGAGGAGGYRNSFNSESSGGGASAESSLTLAKDVAYPVVVGAGGVGNSAPSVANNGGAGGPGSFSQFAWISTVGGGLGTSFYPRGNANTGAGGSGGGTGSGDSITGAPGTVGQGYAGGGKTGSTYRGGSGGGGAGAVGTSNTTGTTNGLAGGAGVASTITGSSVTRGGGGGGGSWKATAGAGGTGGGGAGGTNTGAGTAGTANTGGGGGGGGGTDATSPYYGHGGNGGSGVVIFRVPSTVTVTFSGGVTYTEDTATVPGTNIVSVTATSTISETVTFS